MYFISPKPYDRSYSGFTLIELMVTIAIIGILAAIALPIYRNYIISGDITEATNNLSGLRAKMEQYYQDNRTYSTYSSVSGTTIYSPCDSTNSLPALNAGLKYFQISCAVTNATSTAPAGYTLTALGNSGKLTYLFTYTVDNYNNQSSSTGSGSAWGSITCPTWLTSKGTC